MTTRLAHAFGIGRPVDPPTPPRPHDKAILGRWVIAKPWADQFRFGWVIKVTGPYWHRAYGIPGPDWNDGKWTGGMLWHRHGPIAVCSWRHRGSWRGDQISARLRREFEEKYGSQASA